MRAAEAHCRGMQRSPPAAAWRVAPYVNAARQDDVEVAGLLTDVVDELQQHASQRRSTTDCNLLQQLALQADY